MQVVLSLLDIESIHGGGPALERLPRRVRILALVDELILSDLDADSVDLYRVVVRTLSSCCRPGQGAESLFSTDRVSLRLPIDGAASVAGL
jgi:hypothetical protein